MIGPPLAAVREARKRVHSWLGLQNDATAPPAVATIRPSASDVLLATKTGDPVATISGHHFDLHSVNKHVVASSGRLPGNQPAA